MTRVAIITLTLGVGTLISARLGAQVQPPARPDFAGIWEFVRDDRGPAIQVPPLGSPITIQQDAEALFITRRVMSVKQPGGERGPQAIRFRYPFNQADTRDPQCSMSKTGWDGASLIIVTKHPENLNGCISIGTKQTTDVLTLDKDGALVVLRTLLPRDSTPNWHYRPDGRVGPGENPPIVTTSRYRKVVTK